MCKIGRLAGEIEIANQFFDVVLQSIFELPREAVRTRIN
jgi:hypothetical protein